MDERAVSSENILVGKRIILGITGSIAAYKAAGLTSQLTQMGASVDVVMTEAARRFIAPLTFQALTGRPVYGDMWETDSGGGLGTHIAHVGLAHQADLLLVAPITANSIARLALGLADDLLGTIALAARCPIVIAPAMDAGMYGNEATQGHVEVLRARGVHVAGPGIGRMASGLEGVGRFLEPEEIVGHCRWVLGGLRGRLRGRRVVVTAGPTREALDPVRFLSNYSTGKQGFAVAQAAVDAGAEVALIAGPVGLPTPVGVERIDVESAEEMCGAVVDTASGAAQADALIMAAAVADFRPVEVSGAKVKKGGGAGLRLELAQTADILVEALQQENRPRVAVGFAAESEDVVANAQGKLRDKGLDLIVANDITASDAGFAADTNRVHFVTAEGVEALPLMSKAAVAGRIVAWVADRLGAE